MIDMNHAICNIKVVGVGGAGNNAVNRMVTAGITSAYFVAVNTDKQVLMVSKADEVLQIGKNLTKGLGAGSNPEVGKAAAEESKEDLMKMLQGTDLLFLTTGLGGGSGSGASPVIAKLAREMGILTIGVVTKPFGFEGRTRKINAEKALEEMKKYCDTLIIIPNDKLLHVLKKDISFEDSMRYADDILRQAVQGVSDLIVKPSLINLDFADVSTITKNKGRAHMGIGKGRGANKTLEAVRQAVTSQLLETSIEGATGILINISGGRDLTLSEVYEAVDLVRDVADPECNIIFGATINNDTNGETEITVIATGFDIKDGERREPVPEFKDNSADFKPFVEPVEPEVAAEPEVEQLAETPVEVKVEMPKPEPQRADKVQDISVKAARPVVKDEDIPPFLRKLRR